MFEDIFLRKKLLPDKLLQYGFQNTNGLYSFTTKILNGCFTLTIVFDAQGNVNTTLIDTDTDDEYTLYKTAAQGSFVGGIRKAISGILEDIAASCFKVSVFKQKQTLHLLDYVSSVYGDNLEFLWKKFPNNGIWRRKDTKKWYGAVLTVAKNKLGIDSKDVVEIIDLRTAPNGMNSLLKQDGFYPGWHMNKQHWFTVILDESISNETLHKLIQESYDLAIK